MEQNTVKRKPQQPSILNFFTKKTRVDPPSPSLAVTTLPRVPSPAGPVCVEHLAGPPDTAAAGLPDTTTSDSRTTTGSDGPVCVEHRAEPPDTAAAGLPDTTTSDSRTTTSSDGPVCVEHRAEPPDTAAAGLPHTTTPDPRATTSTTGQGICGEATNLTHDVGLHLTSSVIPDDLKYKLLTAHWHPPKNYTLPFSEHPCKGTSQKRYLLRSHLQHNDWAAYSPSQKGVFCKYCVLFAPRQASNNELKTLVTIPLTKFKKILGSGGSFFTHEGNDYHKSAVSNGKSFITNFQNPELNVNNQLNTQNLETKRENRERLVPIIESLMWIGGQNIGVRGHRDDGRIIVQDDQCELRADTPRVSIGADFDVTEQDPSVKNEGNFRELLKFRVKCGDTKLAEQLKKSPGNATYVSKTTQNQLIECIGEEIQDIILRRVRLALCYGVIFDETTDISNLSQMTLIISYIYENKRFEDFLCFINLHEAVYGDSEADIEPKISGKILGQLVAKTLKEFGLDLNFLTSIGTDTCSMMSSEVCGAVQEIIKQAPNAIWDPCRSHSLNLSISHSSDVRDVANTMSTMGEIVTFFHESPKRNAVLKKIAKCELSSVCPTRFIARHQPVNEFCEFLPKILESLEAISHWVDPNSKKKALNLIRSIDCKFIVTLFTIQSVFVLSLPLSRTLQSKNLDSVTATNMVNNFTAAIETRRENAEEEFHDIFQKASESLEELCIPLAIGRVNAGQRQMNRANVPHNTPEEYYRRSIYIPMLDSVLQDLNTRLTKRNLSVIQLEFLLPSQIVHVDREALQSKCDNLCASYSMLISGKDYSVLGPLLKSEVEMWRATCISLNPSSKKSTALEALLICDSRIFPHVHSLLQVIATSAATVCTAERSFSTLRRTKTWLRSTTTNDRLTGLALMCIHFEILHTLVNVQDVIDRFARKGNRRIIL